MSQNISECHGIRLSYDGYMRCVRLVSRAFEKKKIPRSWRPIHFFLVAITGRQIAFAKVQSSAAGAAFD